MPEHTYTITVNDTARRTLMAQAEMMGTDTIPRITDPEVQESVRSFVTAWHMLLTWGTDIRVMTDGPSTDGNLFLRGNDYSWGIIQRTREGHPTRWTCHS